MRRILLAFALAVAAFGTGAPAVAQTKAPPSQTALPPEPPAPPLPPDYSEESRRAYVAGLKEARELMAQKKFDEAIVRLDALNRERPREPQARFLKSVAQSEAGRTADAFATLTALAADFPELPEVRNNLAVIYASRGSLEAAQRELEAAVASAPDYAPAHENLADIHARYAERHYARAVELAKGKPAPATVLKLKAVREALSAQ
jgi:Flp pilus assembly protein TadD